MSTPIVSNILLAMTIEEIYFVSNSTQFSSFFELSCEHEQHRDVITEPLLIPGTLI